MEYFTIHLRRSIKSNSAWTQMESIERYRRIWNVMKDKSFCSSFPFCHWLFHCLFASLHYSSPGVQFNYLYFSGWMFNFAATFMYRFIKKDQCSGRKDFLVVILMIEDFKPSDWHGGWGKKMAAISNIPKRYEECQGIMHWRLNRVQVLQVINITVTSFAQKLPDVLFEDWITTLKNWWLD